MGYPGGGRASPFFHLFSSLGPIWAPLGSPPKNGAKGPIKGAQSSLWRILSEAIWCRFLMILGGFWNNFFSFLYFAVLDRALAWPGGNACTLHHALLFKFWLVAQTTGSLQTQLYIYDAVKQAVWWKPPQSDRLQGGEPNPVPTLRLGGGLWSVFLKLFGVIDS